MDARQIATFFYGTISALHQIGVPLQAIRAALQKLADNDRIWLVFPLMEQEGNAMGENVLQELERRERLAAEQAKPQ
jgi:hypothetical protein